MADTFQISEADDALDLEVFATNNERITAELATPISVIVGNPPYSVGQSSANDLNANTKYPTLDGRIEATYGRRSSARSQRILYDSYIRAFRWATDRIGDTGGVVAFVSNGGWIDGNTADGIRLTFTEDFSKIYVYNLRGNMRKPNWRDEGGQIFGSGSQATIAIFIGVKDPEHDGACQVYYSTIGDGLTREQKLRTLAEAGIDTIDWECICPNSAGDWIDQRDNTFSSWPVLGEKKASARSEVAVFKNYSLGLATGRDAWAYNSSRSTLVADVQTMISTYEEARCSFHGSNRDLPTKPTEETVNKYLDDHPQFRRLDQVSWNRNAKKDLAGNREYLYRADSLTTATYRPFFKQQCYFHRDMNAMQYQLQSIFPTPVHANIGFYAIGPGATADFGVLMSRLPA